MQQLFREPPLHPALAETEGEACAALPLIRFAVPSESVAALATALVPARAPHCGEATPRKRSRSPGMGGADTVGAAIPHAHPSPAAARARRAFVLYGDRHERPSRALLRVLSPSTGPAALLSRDSRPTPGVAPGDRPQSARATAGASTARGPRNAALLLAIRQALSIICRLVRLDTDALFLLSGPAPGSMTASAASPSSKTRTSTTATTTTTTTTTQVMGPHGFLQLYSLLGGVALELEDAAVRLRVTAPREEELSRLEEIHARAEAHLDAFESTVLNILLDETRFAARRSPPLAYVAELVRNLPSVFAEEAWPAQLVAATCAAEDGDGDRDSRGELGDAAARERMGCATTAVLLKALHELRAADCCLTLVAAGEARDTPVSVIAARMGLPDRTWALVPASSAGGVPAAVVPGVIDMERLTFSTLHARVWAGVFGRLGLRRADVEVRALLRSLSIVAAGASASRASAAAAAAVERVEQTRYLRSVWARALATHYAALVGGEDGSAADGDVCGLTVRDNFALARAPRSAERQDGDGARTRVQEAALRVLTALKATDKDGWFAVPAFDMVNIDFSSIQCWIDSPSFATMTGRAAFDALRGVLERMVDACVQKYGPTHAFSLCIVAVRQQLVDAARREGLLS